VARLSSTNTNRVDRYLRVYFIVIKNPFLGKLVTDSGAFTQRRHWQWRVYTKTPLAVARFNKDATDSDAFTQKRHRQWHVAIRRFKILLLSLLLLIIYFL
jgi:hypothetical protein